MRIGVFDSGVGGLTVLKSLIDEYPNNEYFYIGDNKNNPYGDKNKDELYKYSTKIIDYFITIKIDLIVIACNTICSNVYDLLKEKYNIPLIGVIDATIEEFIKSNEKEVLIMATKATIDSKVYENKIKHYNPNIKVLSIATKELVPLIEKQEDTKPIINKYLENYSNINCIILGCTHYKLIQNNFNKNIKIINSSDGIIKQMKKYIKDSKKEITIYTTVTEYLFNKLCYKITGMNAKKLVL